MSGVFYHSVIHGFIGFFICFIRDNVPKNNKTRFFLPLYSDTDKAWVDQSERAGCCLRYKLKKASYKLENEVEKNYIR